jgi:hypothetical protein
MDIKLTMYIAKTATAMVSSITALLFEVSQFSIDLHIENLNITHCL